MVLGCFTYLVQTGVLLHSTTSRSKSTSEWSGIGAPPNGAHVNAFPQAKSYGHETLALAPCFNLVRASSQHWNTSWVPSEKVFGYPSPSDLEFVTSSPSFNHPNQ